jgi:nucleotidyltransferase substrate binding protein (TIGR01987 family)
MKNTQRWIQRFENFNKAYTQLQNGVQLACTRNLSDIEKEGVIQRFEYTQELAWKVLKDFYEHLGETNIQGSRDAFRLANERNLTSTGCTKALLRSVNSRNDTVHSYNQNTANQVFKEITEEYYQAFTELKLVLEIQVEQRNQS